MKITTVDQILKKFFLLTGLLSLFAFKSIASEDQWAYQEADKRMQFQHEWNEEDREERFNRDNESAYQNEEKDELNFAFQGRPVFAPLQKQIAKQREISSDDSGYDSGSYDDYSPDSQPIETPPSDPVYNNPENDDTGSDSYNNDSNSNGNNDSQDNWD